MPHFTPEPSTRATILRALDMLIDGTNIEEANNILRGLETQYLRDKAIFSLDSLFFGGLITAALDDEFQSQKESMLQIRDQLTGKQPHWNTYALKHNFTGLFNSEMREAFQRSLELLGMIEEPAQHLEEWDRFNGLHEYLHIFLFEILVPTHLSEMLLGLLIQGMLVLPIWRPSEIGESFDAANSDTSGSFCLILPPNELKEIYFNQTQYLRGLVRKIKGEEIVYVDLTIVPNHSLLNIR